MQWGGIVVARATRSAEEAVSALVALRNTTEKVFANAARRELSTCHCHCCTLIGACMMNEEIKSPKRPIDGDDLWVMSPVPATKVLMTPLGQVWVQWD